MPLRDNYKAKWLAAIDPKSTLLEDISVDGGQTVDNVTSTHASLIADIRALHDTLIQGGNAAKSLCEVMDEFRLLGTIDFKEIQHNIDAKISTMPSKIIARRLRDVLRASQERIGLLSIMCMEQQDTIESLTSSMSILRHGTAKLQTTAINTLFIGQRATRDELEDYIKCPTKPRRGSEYNEYDEDWSSVLTNDRSHIDESANNDHDFNSDDDRRLPDHDNDSDIEGRQMATVTKVRRILDIPL